MKFHIIILIFLIIFTTSKCVVAQVIPGIENNYSTDDSIVENCFGPNNRISKEIDKFYRNQERPLLDANEELFLINDQIWQRSYGESQYFLAPTVSDIHEYHQRISRLDNKVLGIKKSQSQLLYVKVTDISKELLLDMGIKVPDFIDNKILVRLPQIDIDKLTQNNIKVEFQPDYGIKRNKEFGEPDNTESTIWTEDFESSFPGGDYEVGDADPDDGNDYWDDENCDYYSSSPNECIWCADIGGEPNCQNYDDNMDAYVYTYPGINVSGYTNLKYYYARKYDTESGWDYLRRYYSSNGYSWTQAYEYTGYSDWTYVYVNLTGSWSNYYWQFRFQSDGSIHDYYGASLDYMKITGDLAGEPNLTRVAGNSSLTIVNGTIVTISITVINNGNATAGSSYVGYYLSENTSFNSSEDYLIGTDYVGSLSPNSTSYESITVDVTNISPPIPSGNYYVMFFIDHLDVVDESNEDDNCYYWSTPQVTVPLDCQPDVEYIEINGDQVAFGGTIDIELDNLNETFEIMLRGENDGSEEAYANINNLTLAFPQYTSSSDKDLISIDGSTSNDLDVGKYFGSEAQGGDQYADYIMVEGVDNNGWEPDESNKIYLDVKPKQWGDFYIEFRMGLPTDNSWNNFVHDPAGGYCPTCSESDPDIDPIKFYCYYIKVNVEQYLINTQIKNNHIFIDKTAKYGIPILFEAKLQYFNLWWRDLPNEQLQFQIYKNGSWEVIPDDNISSTSFTTDSDGVASVYYTASSNMAEGVYPIKAVYNGSSTYESCYLEKNLTLNIPQWAVFIYMCGDNDLEEAYCNSFYNDIIEAGDNDEVSIVTLFDRHDEWYTGNGDWTESRYYKICDNNTGLYENWGELNLGLDLTVINFINTAKNSCLAHNYSFIFKDHGSGCIDGIDSATNIFHEYQIINKIKNPTPMMKPDTILIRAICWDNNPGGNLTEEEIRNAFNSTNDFDQISYHACVMSTLENVYDIYDYTNYFVASEDNTYSSNWHYKDIVDEINSSTTPHQFSTIMVDKCDQQPTLAAWNNSTTNMTTLANNVSLLAERLIELLPYSGWHDIINSARNNAEKFRAYAEPWPYTYVDIREFCLELVALSSDQTLNNRANTVVNQIANTNFRIAWETSYQSTLGGLSIYFPPDKSHGWTTYFSANHLNFVQDSNQKWDDFLVAFFDITDPTCQISSPNNGGWYSSTFLVSANANDNTNGSGILWVEFQYSLNNSNWYPLPGPDSDDGKDWYGDNGWGLNFQTTNTPQHGTINDNSVWVRAKACDFAGNESIWDVCNNPFGIDNTDPSGSITINNGAATTTFNIVTLTLTGIDNLSGVTQMRFSNNGSTWSNWEAFTNSRNWDIFSYGGNTNYGMKTVYAKFKDAALNESIVYTDQIEYIISTPVIASFAINNGASSTSSPSVTLNNSATNSPTHYMASESFNFSGASWINYSTAPNFILSAGYGMKTVYLKVKNSSGVSNVISDNIEYIQVVQPPVINYFAINNGASTTTSTLVTLNNNATNAPTHYMASENFNFNGASWFTYSTAPNFTLSAGYGMKTVYFKVKNFAGNSNIFNDQIEYIDNTVPPTLILQNLTIINGQTECYNATSTITVAGSGTTVHILSGGDATFIAGERIYLKPGFHSHSGSYGHAYITLTGDYCNQQSMVANTDTLEIEPGNIPEIFVDNDPNVRIYPNPTIGHFTIDFMEKATTADILLLNYQGNQIYQIRCDNQLKMNIDISHLSGGMYIIVIKSQIQIITKKIIKVK